MFTGKYLQVNVCCSATQQHASPGLLASAIAWLPVNAKWTTFLQIKRKCKNFSSLAVYIYCRLREWREIKNMIIIIIIIVIIIIII